MYDIVECMPWSMLFDVHAILVMLPDADVKILKGEENDEVLLMSGSLL